MVYTPKESNEINSDEAPTEVFKRANPHIYGEVHESIETLLRYKRKGIQLMPKQKDFLKSRGHFA